MFHPPNTVVPLKVRLKSFLVVLHQHAKHMEGMRARHYEPLEHKGRVGRIDYKLRSSAALKHNPTLPWGTMNTREILNTKGKRSLEYGEVSGRCWPVEPTNANCVLCLFSFDVRRSMRRSMRSLRPMQH